MYAPETPVNAEATVGTAYLKTHSFDRNAQPGFTILDIRRMPA